MSELLLGLVVVVGQLLPDVPAEVLVHLAELVDHPLLEELLGGGGVAGDVVGQALLLGLAQDLGKKTYLPNAFQLI